MPKQPNPVSLRSLRGGLNDTDPAHLLQEDECVVAENVEFFFSSLGERRRGCEPLDMTSSGLTGQAAIVHLSEFFPSGSVFAPELWAIGATAGSSTAVARRNAGSWNTVSLDDAITNTAPNIYGMVTAQTIHGKHFIPYPSAVDFLHVWDGTNFRRVGLAQANAPTAANEGVGTYSATRYFRVREVIQSGGSSVVRGEPSTAYTFNPSGTGAGATITKGATVNTRATHWEVEASIDDANFYRIATVAIGTTTYNDELAGTAYSTTGTLSESIGAYLQPWSAKYVSLDGDRLLFAGHWTDDTKKSMLGWTPVLTDPGVGNEERLPIVDTGGTPVSNTLNVDPTENGEITGISQAANGQWHAFKWNHIYRLQRTSDETAAYAITTISKVRGAIPGSVVSGMDEAGRACVYFLDPTYGPSRIGLSGLQTIRGLRNTWRTVNLFATKLVARGVYYPEKQQVIWMVAASGADSPSFGLKLQVTENRTGDEAVSRGWSTITGTITNVFSMCLFHEAVTFDPGTSMTYRSRPFIGLATPNFIQRTDVGSFDAGTSFIARIRTKPFIVAGLLNKWGAMQASLLAVANSARTVTVKLIRDFGIETQTKVTDLKATDPVTGATTTAPIVIKNLDDLKLSQAKAISVEFSD